MRFILSGNEAIARGFIFSGGKVAAAYPGTPSTEVLVELSKHEGIHAEWSTNEKVAFEVAMGASLAGVRAMACMKHVGVNVAADPLVTCSYTGVNGGLILMAADDPGMFSSQNEQDTRHYARLAKIPCLEPADSQEAMDFVRLAFELSEDFDTPVILRTTTRVSHCKSVVNGSEPVHVEEKGLLKDSAKYVMLPSNARRSHAMVEERLARLKDWGETSGINQIYDGDGKIGIITSGISYQYAREAFPDASILKLGMTYPLPSEMIRGFAREVEKLAVVEELDPFIEEQVRALGVNVHYGKNVLPICGEYSRDVVFEALGGRAKNSKPPAAVLIGRTPTFCPGCSHRGLFTVLSRLKVFVSGDIGCYTLGALPPFSALHACTDMGASIPVAHGTSIGLRMQGIKEKPVAVIGDSTFLHSGITGLINMVYNGGEAIIIIMNNDTTGMTGGQEHPGTGRTASGKQAPKIDIAMLCKAVGASRVIEIDAYDIKALTKLFKDEMKSSGTSVLISNQPCVLRHKVARKAYRCDSTRCKACKTCHRAGCTALQFVGKGKDGYVHIDPLLCNGCGICGQLCSTGAIQSSESGAR